MGNYKCKEFAIFIATLLLLGHCVDSWTMPHRLAMDNYGLLKPIPEGRRTHISQEDSLANILSKRVRNSERYYSNHRNPDERSAGETDQSNEYFPVPKVGMVRRRANAVRERELRELYDKITRVFPMVGNQGLKHDSNKVPTLNELFALTLFGQPRGGKK